MVTFEPMHYCSLIPSSKSSSSTSPSSLRGIRSRTINAKRSDLSQRIIAKIKKDNCTLHGNLRGYNKPEYAKSGQLVRAFFGHTRFATSSKASFEGTHPHLWSERRLYKIYNNDANTSREIGVENYITHNGDFEFMNVNGKYYDVEVVQHWLEYVLGSSMPATVDSAAIAGVIDLLRTQGSFALSARYALCLKCEDVKVEVEPVHTFPTIQEYEVLASYFEEALDKLLQGDSCSKKCKNLEECSKEEVRIELANAVTNALHEQMKNEKTIGNTNNSTISFSSSESSVMEKLSQFISHDPEDGGSLSKFVRGTIDAFFDNDLLHSTRLFLENAKGSFGLCVVSSLDVGKQVCFAAR